MTIVKTQSITLGPEQIDSIRFAFDSLMPWLTNTQFRILNNGALEFDAPEPVEAIHVLRDAVGEVLPEALMTHLGERSGLGWSVFFAHVVGWWLPQRRHMGFLRAFVDRVALHDVDLKLHWNRGLVIEPLRLSPGKEALIWGTIIGLGTAIVGSRVLHFDPILSLLLVAGGLVAGRIYQRVVGLRVCGDVLCRSRLGRARVCPSCGADTLS